MVTAETQNRRPDETASGLEAWEERELPEPPRPKGLQWLGVVGPGVIVLGAAIGSGEFLLGPAAFVQYGLVILWITGVATILQTVYNQELMRYTMYTGEPAFTGFMRTKPSSTFWAWVYSLFYFLQTGIPGWAAAAAGAVFFLFAGRIAEDSEQNTTYFIAVAAYALCVLIVLLGKKIERTLEVLNWAMVVVILLAFLVIVLLLTSPATWLRAVLGYVGYDPDVGFNPIPPGMDPFLLGAVAGYAAAGGVVNLSLSNWARDKGYGMASIAGYIPAMIGGEEVHLAHTGYTFGPQEGRQHGALARMVAHHHRRPVGRVLHRRDPGHGIAGHHLCHLHSVWREPGVPGRRRSARERHEDGSWSRRRDHCGNHGRMAVVQDPTRHPRGNSQGPDRHPVDRQQAPARRG
jgi:hypothetical protein